jgi:3-deoxy-manno-octulosonate cytidylyltransferase (CMP-KDO synthetase)
MIVRVAERVRSAERVDQTLVATDDERIASTVRRAGFDVVMTSPDCASGGDRVAEAARRSGAIAEAALILNVQGDEPLIDPADIDGLIEEMLQSSAALGTIARPVSEVRQLADPNVVKVVAALDRSALYFSRAPIPHGGGETWIHVGIYAYRPELLLRLSALPRTPLEKSESLEQLRALEHGIKIHLATARSAAPSVAVDVPEDIERVLAIMRSRHATA